MNQNNATRAAGSSAPACSAGRWVRVMIEPSPMLGWQCKCGWVNVPDVQTECLQCKRPVPPTPNKKLSGPPGPDQREVGREGA